MTTDDLLNDLLKKEGGYVDHPNDKGGATNWGVTATTLGSWRHLNRQATRAEVKALTLTEARAIYVAWYVTPFEKIPFDEVKAQLVDWGANAGPATAIKGLQRVLGVEVDGVIGPRTLAALVIYPWRVTNNALVGARMAHYVGIVEDDPTQKVFFWGWSRRAISFFV